MTGRIVSSWTPWQKRGGGALIIAERFYSLAARDRWIKHLRWVASYWRRTLFFAVAEPGASLFVCKTLKANNLGRIRVTEGWRFPNGNMLFSSSGVLGVRRQLKRRGRRG